MRTPFFGNDDTSVRVKEKAVTMDANEVYEVLPDGRLSVNGRVLPLDLGRKAIAMDPRLRILAA